MKNFTVSLILTLLVVSLPQLGFAKVVGTEHDMFSQGKGDNPNVCSYCHIPHNAAGEKIWSYFGNEAQLKNGPSTPIGNMCYTCHDGTVTYLGLYTVFSPYVQNHKIPPGEDCNMCHSVHDNTNGEFMNVPMFQDSYCAFCHNAERNAGGWGDHTGAGNHPSYWTEKPPHNTGVQICGLCHDGNGNTGSCNLCHETAHGAVRFSTPEVDNPILRRDNTDSLFCAECHFNSRQGKPGGEKHPAFLDSSGQWGRVTCEECHDPHQHDKPQNPFVLIDQNVDSAFCLKCHDEDNDTYGPRIGDGHPVNVPFSDEPVDPSPGEGTPLANAIDDDGLNGPDYPANSAVMVCETCHSVHGVGDVNGPPLLRIPLDAGALCLNCHTDR